MKFHKIFITLAVIPLIIACKKEDYSNPNPVLPVKDYVDSIQTISSSVGAPKDTLSIKGVGFTGEAKDYKYYWSSEATFSKNWASEINHNVHFASTTELKVAVLDTSDNELYKYSNPVTFYGRNYYFGVKSAFVSGNYYQEEVVVKPTKFTVNPAYKVLADTLNAGFIAESSSKPGYSLSNDIVEIYSQYFNAFSGEMPNVKVMLGSKDVTSNVKYYVNTVGSTRYQYIGLYFKNGEQLLPDGKYDLKVTLAPNRNCIEDGTCFSDMIVLKEKQVFLKNVPIVNP